MQVTLSFSNIIFSISDNDFHVPFLQLLPSSNCVLPEQSRSGYSDREKQVQSGPTEEVQRG